MSELGIEQVHGLVFGDMKAAFAEPGHPGFHLTAPSHTIIDFWGLLKHRGQYHVLYHTAPHRGPFRMNYDTVFFQSTSKNLLDWEMLPIPIAPLKNELRMNDGCICFDDTGTPVMLYTRVWHDDTIPRVHCAAYGSSDLRTYTRRSEEPFMTMDNHGGPRFHNGWSDPYVFTAGGRTFMLMSKCVTLDGKNRMPIYEATDGTMLHWEYKGIFFENNGEVVTFFPIGNKWVLSYSPYDAPEYFTGDFDLENLRFIPETHGYVSYGYYGERNGREDRGFYAHCVMQEDGQTVFAGWISGFMDSEYWDGCMSIPRTVGLDDRLRLTQMPIAAFDTLRDRCVQRAGEISEELSFSPESDMLDLSFSFNRRGSVTFLLEGQNGTAMELTVEGDSFTLNGRTYSGVLSAGEDSVRILIDRSVSELFFGNGTVCTTCCYSYTGKNPNLCVQCHNGARVSELFCYSVRPCRITVDPEVQRFLK